MDVSKKVIVAKSKAFAIRIIRLYQHLSVKKREFLLSKQLLRSGTSVGANVKEAERGQSKKDFVAKMCIALKEAAETEYWLELLHETEFLSDKEFTSIYTDCTELIRILTAIIKTAEGKKRDS